MEEKRKSRPNILLGLTGSVASIKAQQLYDGLSQIGEVQIVATKSSKHFLQTSGFLQKEEKNKEGEGEGEEEGERKSSSSVVVWGDEDEWNKWNKRGDPVLHIELRKWADLLVVAPLSANSLAKISNGQCDNLLTCVARAWDFSRPFFVAPAMNSFMFSHPITPRQLGELRGWGVRVISPIEKTLICGDSGIGAMAEPQDIVKTVKETLEQNGWTLSE